MYFYWPEFKQKILNLARLTLKIFALFLLIGFARTLYATEDTPWIAPEVEVEEKFVTAYGTFGSAAAAAQAWCEDWEANIVDPTESRLNGSRAEHISGYEYRLICDISRKYSSGWVDGEKIDEITATIEEIYQCTNSDYSIGEDNNDDGDIDHCHGSSCSVQNDFMLDTFQNGKGACVAADNGQESCGYAAVSITNESGEQISAFKPTGEACTTTEMENGDMNIIDSDHDDNVPDPNDPNNPPDEENPECTAMSGGFLACSADPLEECDAQTGVCADGCGYVNNNFVCVVDDEGETITEEEPDGEGEGEGDGEGDGDNTGGGTGEGDGEGDGDGDNTGGNGEGLDTSEIERLLGEILQETTEMNEGLNETSVEVDIEPTEDMEGYYDMLYPNGWDDVWANNQAGWDNSATMAYIKTWEVTVSSSAMSWMFCVDLLGMNFGCKDLFQMIDERVWPFIRIIMIFSALVLARKITLGG